MHHPLLVLLQGFLLSVPASAAAAKLTSSPAPTRISPHFQAVTTQAFAPYAADELFKREATASQLITCGYLNGNVNFPRSAQPGFDCRVDTADGIWGFCPTTVIAATDCGLAAACKDSGTCTSICKYNDSPGLLTITCPSSGTNIAYCSTAILTFGVQNFYLSYGYIACGASPKTENYIVTPTFTPSTQTTPTTSKSTTTTSSTSTPTPKTTSSSTSSSSSTSDNTSNPQNTGTTATTATTTAPAGSQSPGTVVTQTNNQQMNSSSNLGPIVGGVLGGLALLCGSAIAVVFILRRNRSNSTSTSKSNNKDDPSPSMSSATPFQPAPPYAPYPHGSTPPPRPSQPPQTQLYPQVYYEADSNTEKYKRSFDHSSQEGYPSYAVELPSTNHF